MNKQPPSIDSARKTGRTQRAVTTALIAAMLGQRVVYVTVDRNTANELHKFASQLLVSAGKSALYAPGLRLEESHLAFSISFYRDGQQVGILRFKSLSEDPEEINRGLRGVQLYRIIDDHAVAELREEARVQQERQAAAQQIVALMKAHGFKHAMIHANGDHTVTE